ncbi:MAG: hypothetical protein H6700_05730 [Myxococcales bacterium]|nr:hypothetical protein [Myxococcales bacterium]MCB9520133.1 hypothetical protein [Myxococcales bacterium]MCB9531246.1 hypothetical protein [Myxococcales bacterium]
MYVRASSLALLPLAVALLAAPAAGQDLSASVGEGHGPEVAVTVENTYPFPVTVIGVRITIKELETQDVHYLSTTSLRQDLGIGGEANARWTGTLTFAGEDGTVPDEYVDWGNYDRTSVGAAIDIDALAAPAEAALAADDWDAIAAQVAEVRARMPIVSRTARFHAPQVAASGLDPHRYFDLERMDALRERLEGALCESASRDVLRLRGSADAQQDQYNLIADRLRGVGLHMNCISGEAKLAAARMLLRSARPQDALLFRGTDSEGNLLPEWRPIVIEANLALARTAAELDVQLFTAIRPALESLAAVRAIDPQNRELLELAGKIVPNAAQWVIRKSGIIERDLDSAQDCLEMIRPTWSEFPVVEQAAATFATALIEAGLEFCHRREYVNSRNRFLRGERLLTGIAEWEANADEINHCRALGALEEGRELAAHPTDDEGPAKAAEKLAEAQQRHTLTAEEIAAFNADVAAGWVAVANRQLERQPPALEAATHSLEQAESINPTGRNDAMRTAWLRFAERMYEDDGLGMTGAQVERAREALARAENVDPDRVSAAEGKLTLAFYGYRVGLPAAAALFGLLIAALAFISKARTKRLAAMSDE